MQIDFLRYSHLEEEDENKVKRASRGISGSREIFYRKINNKKLGHFEFLDFLPKPDAIDIEGFVDYYANSQLFGVYDVNYSTQTLVKGWSRVPDSHRIEFDCKTGNLKTTKESSPWENYRPETKNISDCIEFCRESLENSIKLIIESSSYVACEFSGGIDSSIVLASLLSHRSRSDVRPISVAYPFYEFKNEENMRKLTSEWFGIHPHEIPWRGCLPYSGLQLKISHQTPSIATTSIGYFQSIEEYCASLDGYASHLTGHGGDRLFSTHPSTPYTSLLEERPEWLSVKLYDEIKDKFNLQLAEKNSEIRRNEGWDVSLISPPWSNYLRANGHSGSPFLNVKFLWSMRSMWNAWSSAPEDYLHCGKEIAMKIFPDYLPSLTWNRRGKVDHIGCSYRGAIQNKSSIMELAQKIYQYGPDIGIDPRKFLAETNEVCFGNIPSSLGWGAVISILFWIDSMNNAD